MTAERLLAQAGAAMLAQAEAAMLADEAHRDGGPSAVVARAASGQDAASEVAQSQGEEDRAESDEHRVDDVEVHVLERGERGPHPSLT